MGVDQGYDSRPEMNFFTTKDQQEIITCPARFIFCAAGRRWGKSITADYRAIYQTRKPGFKYWYVTPTYSQLIERYRSIALNPGFQKYIAYTKLQPFPEIGLFNGATIGYRTFERPENLRGAGLDEVAVDEIQDIREESFWPVIRPLLSDRRGSLVCFGQFRGHNWYYKELFLKGQTDNTGLYKSYRFPASTGLMYQGTAGENELKLAKEQLPKVIYQQEYDCEPIANQNAAFDPQDIERITRFEPRPIPFNGKTYIMGLDLGRVKDPSAVIVLEVQTGILVHAEKLPLGMKHEIQAQRVAIIQRRYGARCIVDCTGGATGGHNDTDAYLQYYRKSIPDIKPFFWQRANKERIVHNLCLEIEQSKISVPHQFPDVIKETFCLFIRVCSLGMHR